MKRWYVVQCRAQQDERAEVHMRNQGYEILRPLARMRRQHGGQLVTRIESLFPRYFFVRLDDRAQDWTSIRSTRGVRDFVRFAGRRPAAVPHQVINELLGRVDPRTGFVELSCTSSYRPNQRVYITEGPLAGQQGIFHAQHGEDRVVVLLEILQRAQRLVLPERAIAAI